MEKVRGLGGVDEVVGVGVGVVKDLFVCFEVLEVLSWKIWVVLLIDFWLCVCMAVVV